MDYLHEINAFYDWLETNTLSPNAIALWHALMAVNNKCFWQAEFAAAQSVLSQKAGIEGRTSFYRARNELVQKNLITAKERGGKRASAYSIHSLVFQCGTQYGTQSGTQGGTQCGTQHGTQGGTITSYPTDTQKTNTKTKTKTSPGTRTRATDTSAQLDACELSPDLRERVEDWLRYKSEKGKGYKPTGLKALLTTIQHQAATHGVAAVVECIGESMSNGWQGIIWDRIKPAGGHGGAPTGTTNPFARLAMEERRRAAHDEA